MTYTDDEICAALVRVVSDPEIKIRFGQRVRTEIANDLAAGIDNDSYRLKWLSKTAEKILGVLDKEAKAFERVHDWDMLSVQDYLDVLQTGMKRLKQRAEAVAKKAMKPKKS